MQSHPDDPHPPSAELSSLSAARLGELLAAGELTSVTLVEQLVARVEAVDRAGPCLRSVLEIAPDATDVAAERDAERRSGRARGRLHGLPVIVKDNIDTAAPLHTTAGSLVFEGSSPRADSPLVASLVKAGAVVVGKANLSEWANFRGVRSSSGWSAVGGQTRNPHALDRSPGGSSSGSAAALAARLVPLALGTETDGSLICPAALCGVAALKPTVGLLASEGIVPIAHSQDTAGPMARTAEDLALLLEALDPGQGYLRATGTPPVGLRVGILRGGGFTGYHPPTDRVFEGLVEALGSIGVEVLDPLEPPSGPMTSEEDELVVLTHEFKVDLEAYLASRAGGDGDAWPRTLEDVVAFTESTEEELSDLFDLELMRRATASGGLGDPSYRRALEANLRRSREGLDRLLEAVDVVAVPAMAPAWLVDHVVGDLSLGDGFSPPAVAGYPSATLPMGEVAGLPVGAAFWAGPRREARLLSLMAALTRALGPEVTCPPPCFRPSSAGL